MNKCKSVVSILSLFAGNYQCQASEEFNARLCLDIYCVFLVLDHYQLLNTEGRHPIFHDKLIEIVVSSTVYKTSSTTKYIKSALRNINEVMGKLEAHPMEVGLQHIFIVVMFNEGVITFEFYKHLIQTIYKQLKDAHLLIMNIINQDPMVIFRKLVYYDTDLGTQRKTVVTFGQKYMNELRAWKQAMFDVMVYTRWFQKDYLLGTPRARMSVYGSDTVDGIANHGSDTVDGIINHGGDTVDSPKINMKSYALDRSLLEGHDKPLVRHGCHIRPTGSNLFDNDIINAIHARIDVTRVWDNLEVDYPKATDGLSTMISIFGFVREIAGLLIDTKTIEKLNDELNQYEFLLQQCIKNRDVKMKLSYNDIETLKQCASPLIMKVAINLILIMSLLSNAMLYEYTTITTLLEMIALSRNLNNSAAHDHHIEKLRCYLSYLYFNNVYVLGNEVMIKYNTELRDILRPVHEDKYISQAKDLNEIHKDIPTMPKRFIEQIFKKMFENISEEEISKKMIQETHIKPTFGTTCLLIPGNVVSTNKRPSRTSRSSITTDDDIASDYITLAVVTDNHMLMYNSMCEMPMDDCDFPVSSLDYQIDKAEHCNSKTYFNQLLPTNDIIKMMNNNNIIRETIGRVIHAKTNHIKNTAGGEVVPNIKILLREGIKKFMTSKLSLQQTIPKIETMCAWVDEAGNEIDKLLENARPDEETGDIDWIVYVIDEFSQRKCIIPFNIWANSDDASLILYNTNSANNPSQMFYYNNHHLLKEKIETSCARIDQIANKQNRFNSDDINPCWELLGHMLMISDSESRNGTQKEIEMKVDRYIDLSYKFLRSEQEPLTSDHEHPNSNPGHLSPVQLSFEDFMFG